MDMKSPTVEIEQGKLRGDTGTDLNGEPFLRFRGIPYAKPPVGKLRFKAPQPPEPWTGIKDATRDGDACIARNEMSNEIEGSEDCLVLNVFTKKVAPLNKELKPVMVFIHGGGYTTGSNSYLLHGPEFLLTEDIVLVVINYRLGLLGFLSIKDASFGIPGNNGLKDQTFALKWVQKNISKFGGDPNNVTIFGESAGASSVHLHLLSPLSTGLFHKAILQSGCALNYWAWGSQDNVLELVKQLGVEVSNEKEALHVLEKVSVNELYEAQEKLKDLLLPYFHRPFGVVIEKPNDTAFLTKEPSEIMSSNDYNKVPFIIGYNDKEGLLAECLQIVGQLDKQTFSLEEAIPWEMHNERGSQAAQNIVEELKSLYSGPDANENLYLVLTDTAFLAGIMDSLERHVKTNNSPIFLYRMSVDLQLNFLKNVFKIQHLKGACHADDLGYIFKSVVNPEVKPNSLEEMTVRRFVKLWTNFARTGNPTPSNDLNVIWKPVTNYSTKEYLDIGEELVLGVRPDEERMKKWQQLLKEFPFIVQKT